MPGLPEFVFEHPPQPNTVRAITTSRTPRTIPMPRLRFFPVPARSRPNTPNPLKLAQSVGEVGVEFGRAGTTKDAVAAVVLSVRVLGAYVLLVGLTDVGLKAQVVFVGKVPVHANDTVPL